MKLKLYPVFEHWNQYDRIWLYSDPHFTGLNTDDDNMNKMFNYASPQDQLIEINQRVYKNDLFVCLGDVGNPEHFKSMKCRNRILVKGNHDKGNSLYEPYFMEIYDGPVFISDTILLSHEPIVSENWINFHGHIHNFEELVNAPDTDFCLTANLMAYIPINLNWQIEHGILHHCKNIHRATIDKAIEKKNEPWIVC